MFTVKHIFPSLDTWAGVTVDSYQEAVEWFDVQVRGRNLYDTVVQLVDNSTEQVLRRASFTAANGQWNHNA